MNHDTHLRWIFNKSCNLSPNKMGQLSIFIMYDHPLYLKHTFRIIHNISRQLEKKAFYDLFGLSPFLIKQARNLIVQESTNLTKIDFLRHQHLGAKHLLS